MQGKEIKEAINSLIEEASQIDSNLARRLEQIRRWIKDVKPGSLTAKKLVRSFLLQLITDSKLWLTIKSLSDPEEQDIAFDRMTATEKYWYNYLFAKWLSENDPKFEIWKPKLMAGEFNQADEDVLKAIAAEIVRRGGTALQRYIADLSMATDLIISSRQRKPLCIQITSLSDEFAEQKYENWKLTLQMWGIDRGLFLSYNPSKPDFVNQLVNLTLYNGDNLDAGVYLKFP